jgi:hypothetical protein
MISLAPMPHCTRCLAPFTPGLSVYRCDRCMRRDQDARVAAAERRARANRSRKGTANAERR